MEVKEFKEAIMFLENTLYMCIRGEDEMPGYKVKYNHWIKKVIALLQQGEAYRQMWSELEGEFWSKSDKDRLHMNFEDFSELLTSIIQKYLKEANPNETGKAKDNRE